MVRNTLSALALASLLALPFAGCSEGQSPTEPMLSDLDATSSMASVTEEARGRGRGGDDNKGDDNNNNRNNRRGRGNRNDDRNDDRNNRPQGGREFEGAVASVNAGAGTVTLAGGTRIIVNAQTQWIARGDLFSLSQIAGSLQAGDNPRVEGRGTRQADGSIVAQTIKAEDER
ncbi:MAG TPA: DUF5666 domain-containing protein [Thermoanaerobaculia bacterium]